MTDTQIPKELYYTPTHEWVRLDDKKLATIGITDFAQHNLGEVVFIDLPDLEQHVHAGDEVSVVESVKAAGDVYSPVSGEIASINNDLEEAPSLVNSDPYGDGWLYKIILKDPQELEHLLNAQAYHELLIETEE
ncbi:MAG: glycine cleavage system protein GcvH [Gammaproteobacteria bacterium]